MPDIKIKEKERGTIKTLDKSKVATQKFKDSVLKTKDTALNSYNNLRIDEQENNETEYANDKVENTIRVAKDKGLNTFNKYGKQSVSETKENIIKAKSKIEDFKIKQAEKKLKKSTNKTIKNTVQRGEKATRNIKSATKTGGKAIKTSENTAKAMAKTAKAQAKAAQKTAKMIKETSKRVAKATKAAIKAVIRAIKSIIAATKALISFLIAGGWVVALIIIVVCMIGLLVSSIFGIFFSGEDMGDGSKSMTSVISELNQEFMGKITQIQNDNPYEEYDIEGARASWKDILAVYVAKYSNGDYKTEMMTLDDNKINQLKTIFWDMNEVTFTKDVTTEEKIILHLSWTEHKTIEHVKLHIKINSKTASQMAEQYNFSQAQKDELNELLKDEYLSMWSQVIYGTSGNSDIVNVALSQLGNVGGQPYWSWYGFNSRVEWCATFVSWCANECGYIEKGIIPKFAACESEGVAWFKACGLWQDGGYTPKAGDIIFFDWADKHDGSADHVGIVEKVENGRVYTIEGNSHDECKQRDYDINSTEIRGYGTPVY